MPRVREARLTRSAGLRGAGRARLGRYEAASLLLHAALFGALLGRKGPEAPRAAPLDLELVAVAAAPAPDAARPGPESPRPAARVATRTRAARPAAPPADAASAPRPPDAPGRDGVEGAAAGSAGGTEAAGAAGGVAVAVGGAGTPPGGAGEAGPPAGAAQGAAAAGLVVSGAPDPGGGFQPGPGWTSSAYRRLRTPREPWQRLIARGDPRRTEIHDTTEPILVAGQILDERSDPMVGDVVYGSDAPTRVRDTVYFPGFGRVRSDAVCLAPGGKLRTTVRGYDREICDPRELDTPDPSRYPMPGCERHLRLLDPPVVIEAPAELTGRECATFDYSMDYVNPTCTSWREITFPQRLTYDEISWPPGDNLHWMPIHTLRRIGPCREAPLAASASGGGVPATAAGAR